MYIAFVLIVCSLRLTKAAFSRQRNIGKLVNATTISPYWRLAYPWSFIIAYRSVGRLSRRHPCAVAQCPSSTGNLPVGATIPLCWRSGVLAGLLIAVLVAQLKIPAFVATLAGWLFYKGLLQLVTEVRAR